MRKPGPPGMHGANGADGAIGSGATTVALEIDVGGGQRVGALWLTPADAGACCVFSHGAGAGMSHPFMASIADALACHGIATLRYQFPFMERGSRRPDVPAVAHAAVRAAVATAAALAPGPALFAGGKSFGGRMTSQAQAKAPMSGVQGLFFVGFPLHPAGQPGTERAAHLAAVKEPMLFLQGTRDALAEPALMSRVVDSLQPSAELVMVESADHAFHVPARSGTTDQRVLESLAAVMSAWMLRLASD